MSATGDLIIETAGDLLESQGLQVTGLNQIIKERVRLKGPL